jgi:hypothetical protein
MGFYPSNELLTKHRLGLGRPIWLALILGALLVPVGVSDAALPASRTNLLATPVAPEAFLEVIRARPSPDISGLLARCKSRQVTRDNPLLDILKLRESPDPAAVPILARILSEFRNTGSVYEDAAAEALYATGTPDAHAALAECLLTKFTIPADSTQTHPYLTRGDQFNFAGYWQMQEPLRSGFIAQYVLTNVSTDLVLDVSYTSSSNGPIRTLDFQIGFSNATTNPLILPNFASDLLRTMLYLRRSDGTYPNRFRTGPDPLDAPTRGASGLLPGTRKTYLVRGVLRPASAATERTNWPPFVLEFLNYRHYLTPGDYSLVAMCEAFARPRQLGLLPGEESVNKKAAEVGWWGRAVSTPIKFTVGPKQAEVNESPPWSQSGRVAGNTNQAPSEAIFRRSRL